jgi:hypothetical protein
MIQAMNSKMSQKKFQNVKSASTETTLRFG